MDNLALTSFGVMDTTLEEVFLKVSEEDQSLENSDAGENMVLLCVSGETEYIKLWINLLLEM